MIAPGKLITCFQKSDLSLCKPYRIIFVRIIYTYDTVQPHIRTQISLPLSLCGNINWKKNGIEWNKLKWNEMNGLPTMMVATQRHQTRTLENNHNFRCTNNNGNLNLPAWKCHFIVNDSPTKEAQWNPTSLKSMGTVPLCSHIVNDSIKIKQKYVNKFKALL